MTNKERQKSLDNQKWAESELQHQDMSGSMFYCDYCKYQLNDDCTASQHERETECLCAKAYNRLKRAK